MKILVATLLALLPGSALPATPLWLLASPDGRCVISVTLNDTGDLSYQVQREGRPVILDSPLGLRRQDAAFDHGLQFVGAGEPESRRETYDLFAGGAAHVDNTLKRRTLVFRTAGGARIVIELAASDEGVAFRYKFP